MNYFFTNNFFEIFSENPIAIKWIIAPKIAPTIISSNRIHAKRKAISEGTETIIAIMVPRKIISRLVSFEEFPSDNSPILKNGNKNQIYFIFGRFKFLLFG